MRSLVLIPPSQPNPSHNSLASSEEIAEQTVFQGNTHQKSVSTGNSMSQQSHSAPAPTGPTGVTQTSLIRDIQVGGTQTSPPPQPRKHTESGGTQTTPPQQPHHHGDTQGQLDHSHAKDDNWQDQDKGKISNKGKKGKKKPSEDTSPHPGMTQDTDTVPRTNFSSRNLGIGSHQSSAQLVGSIHTGGRTAHTIIFAQHITIMTMLPICVEPHDRVLQYAFTVAALTTGQVIAPVIHGMTENNHMKPQIP